jgi:hypothetical protein
MNDYNSTEYIINQEFFLNYGNILTCIICHGFLVNPRECSGCQNTFCKICLESCDDKNMNRLLCPMKCKQNIFVNAHKRILQMLETLEIKCFRCCKYFNYNQLEDHVEYHCEKLKFECSYSGCTEKIPKDSIADHLQTCEYGITECEECRSSTMRKNLKKIIETNRKMIREKNTEIAKNFKEIYNLKESNENISVTIDTLQKEIENQIESIEILQKENANLKEEMSSIKGKVTYEIISQMFGDFDREIEVCPNKKIDVISFGPVLNTIDTIILNSKMFLNVNEINLLFGKLLVYHNKIDKKETLENIERVMKSICKTHKEFFKTNKELETLDVFGKFIKEYFIRGALENNAVNLEFKKLRVLNLFINYIEYNFLDKYWNDIKEILLKFLKENIPTVRKFSCSLLKIFVTKTGYKDLDLYINDILNALVNAINYISDGQYKNEWEDARDNAIAVMGYIIYWYHEKCNLNGNVWMTTWLSFFTFDLDLGQTKSYLTLCHFLSYYLDSGDDYSKVLFGNNMENFPKIITLLANIFNTKNSTNEIDDDINSILKNIKDDPNLQEYVRLAKENCKFKILEKLQIHFP